MAKLRRYLRGSCTIRNSSSAVVPMDYESCTSPMDPILGSLKSPSFLFSFISVHFRFFPCIFFYLMHFRFFPFIFSSPILVSFVAFSFLSLHFGFLPCIFGSFLFLVSFHDLRFFPCILVPFIVFCFFPCIFVFFSCIFVRIFV